MGTWGYGIRENDTSFDVSETFFEKYNAGMEPDAIRNDILEQFAHSLGDEEDRDNVLFPLAQCLWEVCALNEDMLANIRENILHGVNTKTCRALGASDDFLNKRRVMLDGFLMKISIPKDKPKLRKKPPKIIESTFRAGSCLAFQYPNGDYGGAVVISSEFFNTKGNIHLALTTIRSGQTPVFEDFKSAKLIDFEWESVFGQSERYAAVREGGILYTGRVHQHSLNYDSKHARASFENGLTEKFHIVGELPTFTQILCATTWIDDVTDSPAVLDYYYHMTDRPVSKSTLGELVGSLSLLKS